VSEPVQTKPDVAKLFLALVDGPLTVAEISASPPWQGCQPHEATRLIQIALLACVGHGVVVGPDGEGRYALTQETAEIVRRATGR
jgi:hypothetical protein